MRRFRTICPSVSPPSSPRAQQLMTEAAANWSERLQTLDLSHNVLGPVRRPAIPPTTPCSPQFELMLRE